MNRSCLLRILLTLIALFAAGLIHAQSPRAQLNQLVTQLQGSPGDNVLRERIIKLAQEIKPPPAVPEEARRHFVEGTAIAKSAQNAPQQVLAVQSFQEALKVAPWWGDVYYNLAVAQELAGQFDSAQDALKLYILTNPGEKEAREAQDRIYAINAKKRLAAAGQNAPEVREQKFFESLNGGIWVLPSRYNDVDPRYNNGVSRMWSRPTYEIRDRVLIRRLALWNNLIAEPPIGSGKETERISIKNMRFTVSEQASVAECNPVTFQISEDGSSITRSFSCYGGSHTEVAKRAR